MINNPVPSARCPQAIVQKGAERSAAPSVQSRLTAAPPRFASSTAALAPSGSCPTSAQRPVAVDGSSAALCIFDRRARAVGQLPDERGRAPLKNRVLRNTRREHQNA